MPAASADAAFVATYRAVYERATGFSEAQGWRYENPKCDEEYEEAMENLKLMGVAISGPLRESKVSMDEERRQQYEKSPWVEDAPVAQLTEYCPKNENSQKMRSGGQKLHSRIMRVLEAVEAVQVTKKEGHDVHWNEAALSSGGPGTGKFWTSLPRGKSTNSSL